MHAILFLTIQAYPIQPLHCQKMCFNIFNISICTCIYNGHLQQSCFFSTKLHAYFTELSVQHRLTVHT